MIDHQLKAKCESWRVSVAVHKETLISYSQRAEQAKDESQDLIIRITKLQKRLTSQLWKICFPKVRARVEKE